MHRHSKVWPILRCFPRSRSAATAARSKPAVSNTPSDYPLSNSANQSLPAASYPSTKSEVNGQSTRWQSLSHNLPPNAGRSSVSSKWVALQPNSPSSSSSSRPQTLSKSPASGALSKWARTVPIPGMPSDTDDQQPLSSRHNATFSPSIVRTDSRLQREVAPHQDSRTESKQLPEHSHFDRSRQRHQRPVKYVSSSRLPPNSGTSSRKTEGAPRETYFAPEPASFEWAEDRSTRSGRLRRVAHKERGSLLLRMNQDTAIPRHLKYGASQKHIKTKKNSLVEKRVSPDVYIPSTVSVGTLARLLGVRLEHLQHRMRQAGMAEEAKYDHILTSDYAVLLTEEFGRNPVVDDEAAFDLHPPPPHPDPSSLMSRPPIVTIMGHVDHGKTTLLDSLRSASVAKGEAGGITQHIGAFSVPVPGANPDSDGPRSITFLDTPGHAAFSAMRARGASVTDFVVLVVAADDGIMPQTKEVIDLIKKDRGELGVVVAINKVDKPGVDIDAVHKALMAENIQLEVFGGDIPSVEVSGLTGHGLPELIETLSAIAEVHDLRAERDGLIQGYVLESKMHKGLGPVATVLVLRGCLNIGSHLISGVSHAKVRVMSDSNGATVKTALPGMAVTVSGWKTLPKAGDEVLQGTEADVKKAVANRLRKAEIESSLADVEAINSSRRQERERRTLELEYGEDDKCLLPEEDTGPKELRLIIKADVSGSAEAVVGALQDIGNKEARTRIVSSGVGDISASDIMMAKAVGGTIVGFSVSASRSIETLATQNEVPLCLSNIIYRLMDDIKGRVIALLPVIIETRVTGEATVLQLFDIHLKAKQTKKVAGCRVVNGIIDKSKFARVIRNGVKIHDEGTLDTMRHLKKDVVEVRKGSECGVTLVNFADLREGDVIQMYEKLEKPGVL